MAGQSSIDSGEIDSKYREDQFYFSATYNLLGKKPSGVSQQGFSTGFHLGFIRDMPINEKRNVSIGLGLGLSSNSYNSNLFISETSNMFEYSVLNDSDITFTKNKFTTYIIELPLEFRWRTSDKVTYKFWRIYTGLKLGYVFHSTSKFRGSIPDSNTANGDFEKLQYGLTLSVGYGTLNFHVYYGLNTIFNNDAILNGDSIDLNTIKLGLITYIL